MPKQDHIGSLKPDPGNARRHTSRNVAMIQDALQSVGAARSIVIDEDNTILAGNATIEAAAQAGIERMQIVEADGETIIAVRRRGLTPEQKRQLALFDNRTAELAEWDAWVIAGLVADTDLSGLFTDDELTELLARLDTPTTGLTDPDAAPEPPAEPITQPGDLWRLGRHRLLCGDSTKATDVERLFGRDRASLVWTDPPYGVAIGEKNKFLNAIGPANRVEENLVNDTLDEASLSQMLRDAFSLTTTICTAGAAYYVMAPAEPSFLRFGEVLRDLGIYRQTLVWVKNTATLAPLGVSYHWAHELICYGWLPNGAHCWLGDRKQTTVWQIDKPMKSPEHPTMKPVALVARAIEHSLPRGDIVHDPFLGSGTTMIAAEQLGRVCYGMEIDATYATVIIRRWENFTGQTAEREQP